MADEHPQYRLLTGEGDRAFSERVSQALDEGYELHGAPSIAVEAGLVWAAQAVVRRPA